MFIFNIKWIRHHNLINVHYKDINLCLSLLIFMMLNNSETTTVRTNRDNVVLTRTELEQIKQLITRPLPVKGNMLGVGNSNVESDHEGTNARLLERKLKAKANFEKLSQIDQAKRTETDLRLKDTRPNAFNESGQGLHTTHNEVKYMDKLIDGAKCMATRIDQVKENSYLRHQAKLQEDRLDAMVEEAQAKDLARLVCCENERKEKGKQYISDLKAQIEHRTKQHEEKRELKHQENVKITRELEENRARDLQLKKEKAQRHQLQMQEINRSNKELHMAKKSKMQSIENELKANIHLPDKIKQEEQRSKEKRDNERKEQMRLRYQQIQEIQNQTQKSLEIQQNQDMLRAKRAAEEKDRQYRAKLQQDILNKKALNEQLFQSRQKQIQEHQDAKALHKELQRKELQKILNDNIIAENKEKEEKKAKKMERLAYAEDLKKQMNEVLLSKKQKSADIKAEKQKINHQEEERRRNVELIINEKINTLRQNNVPEPIVHFVEKQGQTIYEKLNK